MVDEIAGQPDSSAAETAQATAATAEAPAAATIEPVVIGYDGSDSSRHALSYAANHAAGGARSLLVVHIRTSTVRYDWGFGCPAPTDESDEDLLAWLQTELDEQIDTSGWHVEFIEGAGDPARRIGELAAERHAGMIVLGVPEHRFHHVFGSVPAWLARHACCPVTVVP